MSPILYSVIFMFFVSHFVKTSYYLHFDMYLSFSYICVNHFIVCQPFYVVSTISFLAAISCHLSHFHVVSVIFMLCQPFYVMSAISCCVRHSIFLSVNLYILSQLFVFQLF
jgi:hypothetical protein